MGVRRTEPWKGKQSQYADETVQSATTLCRWVCRVAQCGRAPDSDAQTSKHGTIHNLVGAVVRSSGLFKEQNHAKRISGDDCRSKLLPKRSEAW